MIEMSQDLAVDVILPEIKASNAAQALQAMAREISRHISYPANDLFERLMDAEEKSPSAMGEGIAIPHLELPRLLRPCNVLARLKTPVAFNAPDHKSVDLICLVLSPRREGPQRLRRLSRISRYLLNRDIAARLREAESADAMRATLQSTEGWMLAA